MGARPLLGSLAGLVMTAAAAGCGGAEPPPSRALDAGDAPVTRSIAVELVADGFERPTHASGAPGDKRGLWVLEQTGRLWRLGPRGRRLVLDVRGQIAVGAEQGLLGLAFHPRFARNRRLFVDFTDRRGDTRVVQYRVGRSGRAVPSSRRELLEVRQPEENHNGGALAFGPDGRLYVGMGDGGGAFDPRDNAQDPRSRLGKVLAADVDAGPRSPEWAVVLTGLRNPWRLWFDPAMNELWIGDVGQDRFEEIDRVPLEPDEPPKNLGWPAYEGERRFGDRRLGGGELVAPTAVYSHEQGCSVTGGLTYRGTAVPKLSERYLFGDFCTGRLWTVAPRPGGAVGDARAEAVRVPQLTHIGTDAAGEIVFATADGKVLRVVAA